jgi:hypothetical protein
MTGTDQRFAYGYVRGFCSQVRFPRLRAATRLPQSAELTQVVNATTVCDEPGSSRDATLCGDDATPKILGPRRNKLVRSNTPGRARNTGDRQPRWRFPLR